MQEKMKLLFFKVLKVTKILLLILITLIALTCLYKFIISYNILDFKVLKVSTSKIDKDFYTNRAFTDKQLKNNLKTHPEDYNLIEYKIGVKNKSKKLHIIGAFVFTKLYADIKGIAWDDPYGYIYASEDGAKDLAGPGSNGCLTKAILIKSKGLSQEQILKLVKNIKFKAIYVATDVFLYDSPRYDDNSKVYDRDYNEKQLHKAILGLVVNYKEFKYNTKKFQ